MRRRTGWRGYLAARGVGAGVGGGAVSAAGGGDGHRDRGGVEGRCGVSADGSAASGASGSAFMLADAGCRVVVGTVEVLEAAGGRVRLVALTAGRSRRWLAGAADVDPGRRRRAGRAGVRDLYVGVDGDAEGRGGHAWVAGELCGVGVGAAGLGRGGGSGTGRCSRR